MNNRQRGEWFEERKRVAGCRCWVKFGGADGGFGGLRIEKLETSALRKIAIKIKQNFVKYNILLVKLP